MAPAETLHTVDVMLNGLVHHVVVSGNNAPAFGFESVTGSAPGSVWLRFRCDVCNAAAKIEFAPPSASWRRPFVIRQVVHGDQANG